MNARRGDEPGGRMPLRAHLVELRRRVFLAAIGVVVGAVIGWFLYDPVFTALQRPIELVAAERDDLITLNFAGIATSFDMQVKVSFFLGVILSSPWWLYQFWAFVTPGLTRRERGYAHRLRGRRRAAVPRGRVHGVVGAAQRGAAAHRVHADGRDQHHRRPDVPRASSCGIMLAFGHRVPAADHHGRAQLRRDRHRRHVAQGLAVGGAAVVRVRRDRDPDARTRSRCSPSPSR